MTTKPPLWTKTYTLLFCTNLLMWSGFSLMLSTMSLYVLQIGALQSQIGIITGIYPLAALTSRPFSGYAYDTIGRKKVFLISLALFSLMTFAYIPATSVSLLVLVRILQGLFFGIATTGAGTIVADIVPPSRLGEGVGYSGLGNTVAMAIGPAVGIWLMNAYGFMTMFFASGVIMTVSFIMALFVKYPKHQPKPRKLSLHTLIEKRVLSVGSMTLALGSISGAIMAYVIVFSKEINVVNGGIYFMLNAAGVAISRLFSGRIMDRKGPRSITVVGLLLMAAGVTTLAFSTNTLFYGLASFLVGLGNGTVMPTLQAMVINMVPNDRRGAATATNLTAVDAGIGGGSIILGWIAGLTSISTMFIICALMFAIPLALFIFYVSHDYTKKAAEVQQRKQETVILISS